MGVKDTWATHYRSPTSSFTESEVHDLFSSFEVLRFHERDEIATTALGRMNTLAHLFSGRGETLI